MGLPRVQRRAIGNRPVKPYETTVGPRREPGPSSRPPLGTRPTVPEPESFLLPMVPREPIPLGTILSELFPGASSVVLQQAEQYFRSLRFDFWLAARAEVALRPPQMRLAALQEIAEREGRIPPWDLAAARTFTYRMATPSPLPLRTAAAPPQPVKTCIVNDFDPRWGTPPAAYMSIPLQFDASTGYYVFDEAYALRNAPKRDGQPPWSALDRDQMRSAYGRDFALQPFRRSLASPWEFRWVPRRANPSVTCVTG